jgi:hypothetical protein
LIPCDSSFRKLWLGVKPLQKEEEVSALLKEILMVGHSNRGPLESTECQPGLQV